ncbi:MAG: ATP-binding protein [Saprospiraceae bacterium]
MKGLFRLIFLIALSICNMEKTSGQTVAGGLGSDLEIVRYQWTQKEGLPDWNISNIFQDSKGLMWIAANAGLFTFDGIRFRMVNAVNESLRTGRIIRVEEDLHQNIWVVRQENDSIRVEIFNPKTGKVQDLQSYSGFPERVNFRLEKNYLYLFNKGGKIWIGSNRQGYYYDGKLHKKMAPFESEAQDQKWLPAPKGLYWLPGRGGTIALADRSAAKLDSFTEKGYLLRWYWLDKDLNFWAAYSKAGVGTIDHYYQLVPDKQTISVRYFRNPPKTNWGNEIITSPEWFMFEPLRRETSAKTDERYLGPPDNPLLFNLTRNFPDFSTMSVFYFDHNGSLWASNTNGLSRFVLTPRLPFKTYLCGPPPPYSMRGLLVEKDILYALNYNGARQIRLSDATDRPWPYPDNEFSYTVIKHKQAFWVGSHEKPVLAFQPDGSWRAFPFDGAQKVALTLYGTKGGELLAGTQQGIWRLDTLANKFLPTPFSKGNIFALHENRSGLWALTSNGLYLLDARFRILQRALEPGNTLPYSQLEHLYEDPEGLFWIASKGAGLLCWSPMTKKLRKYTTRESLSSNNIHAIYPDGGGRLWLSSDHGLMCFDPRNAQVRTYFKEDGISDNEFNYASHCRAADGTLFFGGINGITRFHPDDFQSINPKEDKLHITEIRTFDLKKGVYFTRSTFASSNYVPILRPSDAYLDIHLSTLDYDAPDKRRYAWKIKGFQNNWVYQEEPVIRLSKLPYGRCELQVRYSRLGNGWSKVQVFPVIAVRPFYLKWPFLLLSVVVGIAFSLLISYMRTRRLHKVNLRLEQEVKQRTQQIEENLAIIQSDKQTIFEQAQELRTLDQMKSRFFTNVTHELRTPLTLILGPLERLLYGRVAAENTQDHLRAIQRNALKLLNLVEELLDLSKMEANKLVLEEKPTPLKPFLGRIVAGFAPYAEHRKIGLRLQYNGDHELTLLLDQKKFEKILNNLIGNALKFTPAMGTITLSARMDQGELLIEVMDTGRGIDPADLPFVFERYFQSKSGDNSLQGGTGIGLSLSREYARMFGGDLTMESALGQGTVASLRFPPKILQQERASYYEEAPFPAPSFSAAEVFSDEGREAKPRTILVVEDDKDMLDYLVSILAPSYRLLLADNGNSALSQLEIAPVDLVLSDVMMPGMDGFQLLQAVKDRYQDLPFILLTARVETPDRLLALRLGVDDYLTKPFMEEELSARLNNLLERYETRRRIRAMPLEAGGEVSQAASADPIQSFDKKWLIELETMVQANLNNPHLSVQTLADKMAISERTLQNKIKAFTGLTPNQYLTEARLQKARLLLEARAFQTVSEVCYAVGFKTTQYFAAIMKKRFGKSPTDYFR